ncbi:molybdenum cofactor guanylyltransferase MobA [Corticibacterium sp. UT-5YL-CI-8]|nr:molybdenum cofactor guanylyltransferase MobA [Tianweitania sp. UT-5YL-CI-8]
MVTSGPQQNPSEAGGKRIAGVILAGGRSSRMGGGEKGLLDLGGRTLLQHVADRLAPQVDTVALNSNGEPEFFVSLGVPVVADTLSDRQGPLAGVLTGMIWARSQNRFSDLVTVTCDTPFFPADLTARLLAARRRDSDVVIAASNGRDHPVFGLWSLGLEEKLAHFLKAQSDRSVMAFIRNCGYVSVSFDFIRCGDQSVDPFFNINTPRDMTEAARYIDMA